MEHIRGILRFLLVVSVAVLFLASATTARRRSHYNRHTPPLGYHQQQQDLRNDETEQFSQVQDVDDYGNFDGVQRTTSSMDFGEDDDGRQIVDPEGEGWEEFSQNLKLQRGEKLLPARSTTTTRRSYSRYMTLPTVPTPVNPTSTTPKPTRSDEVVPTLTTESLTDTQPETTTTEGNIKGKIITLPSGENVIAFLGIPYAKPPVGDRKFKKPVPADKFEETYDATTLPNACHQQNITHFPGNRGEAQWNPNTEVSEDCLYLNIWVPASVFEKRKQEIVPVMFWIYGGGFYSGSSSLDIYNGASFASANNVIVVSCQYRLGPLGFLFFATEDAPGNVGMLDQVLALKWTNRNIKYFGGDTDLITLFGESAGATSVSLHSLSPLSKSLFKRTIMLSGASTPDWAVNNAGRAKEVSYQLAQNAGCDIQMSPAAIIECLKGVDASALTSLQWKSREKFLDLIFKPTVDSYFLNDMPMNLLNKGQAKRHEIIIGTVGDEGSYFALYHFLQYFNEEKATSISFDKYVYMMKQLFPNHSDFEKELIIDHYTNWENPNDGYDNQQMISRAIADGHFVCPLRQYADIWSNRGLKVFFQHFTQRTSSNPWAEWMGVMHGDEIDYVFGVPATEPLRFSPEEADLSKHMQKLFTQFATTGVPSPKWERYASENPIYVNLNATIISDETNENKLGPHADDCVFWNRILPEIRAHFEDQNQPSTPKYGNAINPNTQHAFNDFRSQQPHCESNLIHNQGTSCGSCCPTQMSRRVAEC